MTSGDSDGQSTLADPYRQFRVQEALNAHDRGWSLTPLNGKRPILNGWTQLPRPSRDQVADWANRGNVGLRTGQASGVVVVDDDTPEQHTQQTLPLPQTVTAISGSGKRHYYFAAPQGDLSTSHGKLGDKIDLQADGAQVVFPGSRHPDTGDYYTWAPGLSPNEVALAPFPARLLGKLLSASTPRRNRIAKPPASSQVVTGPVAPPADDAQTADVERIAAECGWMEHCRDDSATLSEPEWYAMLSILGRCDKATEKAHAWSASYHGYDHAETERKLDQAATSAGPRTCQNIREALGGAPYCDVCKHNGHITSPIVLGHSTPVDAAHTVVAGCLEDLEATQGKGAFASGFLNAATLLQDQDTAAFVQLRQTLKDRGVPIGIWEEARNKAAKQRELDARLARRPERVHVDIQVNDAHLRDQVSAAWDAVRQANATNPFLFQRDGVLVWIKERDAGPAIEVVSFDHMIGLLTHLANWSVMTDQGPRFAHPDKDVAKNMLSMPHADIPQLDSIVTVPVFGKTGALLVQHGYYASDNVYLHNPLPVREIPSAPSAEEVHEARELLLEPLVDFNFSCSSDRAHAVGMLILPLARRLVDDCTPLHSVEAPTPGSGKTLLCEIACEIALGSPTSVQTFPSNDEETGKLVTSLLAEGAAITVFDNAAQGRKLDSPVLAAVITSRTWRGRILGSTKTLSARNESTWIITANNPQYSMELARRLVRIRIDPKQDRPWDRTGFRHDPLLPWVRANRSELVRAILLLIQNWIARGRPQGQRPLGSFDSWARTIGGIVAAAGLPDFLGDREQTFETADAEGEMWRSFAKAWLATYGERSVPVAELHWLCTQESLLFEVIGDQSEQSQKIRLGKALATQRERIYDGLRIELVRDSASHGRSYRLVKQVAPPGDVGDIAEDRGTLRIQRPHGPTPCGSTNYNGDGDVGDVAPTLGMSGKKNPAGSNNGHFSPAPDSPPVPTVSPAPAAEAVQRPQRPHAAGSSHEADTSAWGRYVAASPEGSHDVPTGDHCDPGKPPKPGISQAPPLGEAPGAAGNGDIDVPATGEGQPPREVQS